jgi:serine/threonine protein kinase/WD40 repeat protein
MAEFRPTTDLQLAVAERALELFERHRAELLVLAPAERILRLTDLSTEPAVRAEIARICALTTLGVTEPSIAPHSPRELGPGAHFAQRYRILRKLGEGAAAVVYLADQQGPLKRQVAIKVLLSDLHSPQAAHRFQSECEALARMNHPAIASLHDAGRTREGLPYVVMEYVDGEPIDLHARNRHLTVRQRAELMVRVCRGVHHAHQKGIVHRDLSPGNILVAHRDGQSLPKIIDFGIAKLTSSVLPRATVSGLFVGTPGYMSPEQAGVGEADVDTISDVYSLGVIFYELLTGALPLVAAEEDATSWQRALATGEPIKPSARLEPDARGRRHGAPSDKPFSVPIGVDPREVTADLDSVVLKALARERELRYSSASEFAADIERVLSGEPVLARPPSFTYQLGRLLRRHAALTASLAVLLVTALISAFIIADLAAQRTAEAEQAEIAREHARAERELAWERQVIAERMTARGNLAYARVALELGDAGTAKRNLEAIEPNFRGWEWRWLVEQADRSSATAVGHTGAVRYLTSVATGELLVSGGDDGTLRLWGGRDLQPLATYQVHDLPIAGLAIVEGLAPFAISTDGRSLVATDLATGLVMWQREGVDLRIGPASLSLDGAQLIVAEGEGDVGLLDSSTGLRLSTFEIGTSKVIYVGFGPRGTKIYNFRNFIRVIDGAGAVQTTIFGRMACLSPDREVVGFSPLSRWDDRGVSGLLSLSDPIILPRTSALDEMAIGPGDQVFTTNNLNTLHARSRSSLPPETELLGHESVITAIQVGVTGESIYSADAGGVLKRWDSAIQPVPFGVASTNDVVYGARVAPDEDLMATTGWGTVKLWETRTGVEVATHWWTRAYSTSVAFSPAGRWLAVADWLGRVAILKVPLLEPLALHDLTSDRITSLYWQPPRVAPPAIGARADEPLEGLLVAGTHVGELIAINPADGQVVWRRMTHPGAPVTSISGKAGVLATAGGSEGALPDFDRSKENLIASDPYVRLTAASTGEPLGGGLSHPGPYAALAWSPSGRELAAGAEDGTVTVWSMPSGTMSRRKPGVGSGISALTWSQSGKRIIIGHETGALIIADATSLEFLVTLPEAPVDISTITATRDGRALLAAGREVPLVAYEIEPRAPPAARAHWAAARARAEAHIAVDPGVSLKLASHGIAPESDEGHIIRARGLNPNMLNSEAWGVILAERGRVAEIALARLKAEVAASGWPIWQFENTRALARLRAGDFVGALASVDRSVALQRAQGLDTHPSDWAIAALAAHGLNRDAETQRYLALSEREAATPQWRGDAEVWQLVDEARQRASGLSGPRRRPKR